MAEVTFPVELGGDGNTYTDDASPTTGMAAGGHRIRFVPALSQAVIMTATAKSRAEAAQAFRNESVAARNAAQTSETNAASSAASANSSKTAAATSAANAKTSETNAASSASAANTSKNAAATSAANAKTSETNAGGSATSANASKNAAATSETNAASSASAANSSKNAAAGSASAASTSATNAASSASSASSSASSATSSKNAAATSASNASTSAGAALASKNAAATSESNAASSASSATASKNAAASSASNAATSETNAAASASSASADAASIANSETLVTGLRDETVAAAQDVQQYADLLDESVTLPTLDWNFTTGKYSRDNGDRVETTNLSELATVTRPDTKQVFGPNGFQRSVIAGAVARQWNPVTGEAEGVVQEKASKNLFKFSEAFEAWDKDGANIHAWQGPYVSSAGRMALVKCTESGSYKGRVTRITTLSQKGWWVTSVYAKAGESNFLHVTLEVPTYGGRRVWFDLSSGEIGQSLTVSSSGWGHQAEIEDVGEGVFRCSLAVDINSLDRGASCFYTCPDKSGGVSASLGNSIYIWGAQLELGDKPTSYIPTPATFESRASSGTYFDSNGVLQTAAIDQPRENHVLVDGEWVSQGLLIEPKAATNMLLWSETNGASWPIDNNATRWANTPVVMRGITLDKFVKGTSLVDSISFTDTPSSATSATWGVFFYDGGPDAVSNRVIRSEIRGNGRAIAHVNVAFDFTTKAFSLEDSSPTSTLRVVDIGSGVYRVWVSLKVDEGETVESLRTAIYGNNKWLGGFQLEEGTQPSSYIKTTDAPVTRAADVVSSVEVERAQDDLTAPLTGEYNPRQGTWVIDAEHNDVAPLTGIGLNGAYTSGKGKLVYSYDENGGEAFVAGAKAFDTPPVKNAQNVSLGHQTTGRVQYFPKKLSMAQALARATGSVEVDYPFADGRSLYTNFATNDYGVQAIDNAVDTLRSDNASDVLTVERATSKWVLKEHGLYEEVPIDTVAREWNPETSEYAALIEGSATNELVRSAEFDNSAWAKENSLVSAANETQLFSDQGAYILTEDSTASIHRIFSDNSGSTLGNYYAFSAVVASRGRNKGTLQLSDITTGGIYAYFDLATGVVNAGAGGSAAWQDVMATITPLVGGFFRVTVSGQVNEGTKLRAYIELRDEEGERAYQGDDTSGIYIAHAQLEQGTRPTSPIITTDAPKTRAADVPTRTLGAEFNASEGTFICEIDYSPTGQSQEIFDIRHDGGVFQFRLGSNDRLFTYQLNEVDPTVSFTGPDIPAGKVTVAMSFSASGTILAVNGVTASTPGFSKPAANPLMNFLQGNSGVRRFSGRCFYASLLSYAMTEAQLQELTRL